MMKKKSRLILAFIFIISSFDIVAQDGYELILGKWIGQTKVLLEGSDTVDFTPNGKGYTNNTVLYFAKDGSAIISPDQNTTYSIDQGHIRIGTRIHKIESLTIDTLIISNEGFTPELRFWNTFVKAKEDI